MGPRAGMCTVSKKKFPAIPGTQTPYHTTKFIKSILSTILTWQSCKCMRQKQ